MTRAQLIDAVTTATSLSYDLDIAIYTEVYGPPEPLNPGQDPGRPATFKWLHGDGWREAVPPYTASVDVVLDLIHFRLYGQWWLTALRQNGLEGSWTSSISRVQPTLARVGTGTGPSRALVTAFLRALPT